MEKVKKKKKDFLFKVYLLNLFKIVEIKDSFRMFFCNQVKMFDFHSAKIVAKNFLDFVIVFISFIFSGYEVMQCQ